MITTHEPRLVISRRPTRRDHLHGAWWPRTTALDKELGPLLEAVAQRFQTVLGVMLNRDEWPDTLTAGQPLSLGKAKVSWYGLAERHLVVLRCGDARRISLLLLAPDTPEQTAITATLMASAPGNALTTEETLTRAREAS